MNSNKSKIVMKSPDDALVEYNQEEYSFSLYVQPYGENRINELIDFTINEKGYRIPYHYFSRGAVTFTILKGRIELVINGKECVCDPGDTINITAHCPYSLSTLDDESVIKALFTDVDMISRFTDYETLTDNFILSNEFMEEKFYPDHNYFPLTEPVDTEKVNKHQLVQVKSPEDILFEYHKIPGINCKLKVGRWELKGLKEIWEFDVEKGYVFEYLRPTENEGLYEVESGKVKIRLGGNTLFAEAGDLIHIPHYTPYTLTSVEDNTTLLDYNVSSRLYRMLDMMQSAQRDTPEKIDDPQWIKWLFDMNDCYLTDFKKVDNT